MISLAHLHHCHLVKGHYKYKLVVDHTVASLTFFFTKFLPSYSLFPLVSYEFCLHSVRDLTSSEQKLQSVPGCWNNAIVQVLQWSLANTMGWQSQYNDPETDATIWNSAIKIQRFTLVLICRAVNCGETQINSIYPPFSNETLSLLSFLWVYFYLTLDSLASWRNIFLQ